jgi:hypothetical protein
MCISAHLESGIFLTQGRNSIDIENEERDIEMFKQFDLNCVPPKQKIKCNINMNDILVNPSKKSTVAHMMSEDFDKRQTSSTNSNSHSPSSLASSSMDELYEKTYYATHHNLTDEKSSAASSLFSSSNGM